MTRIVPKENWKNEEREKNDFVPNLTLLNNSNPKKEKADNESSTKGSDRAPDDPQNKKNKRKKARVYSLDSDGFRTENILAERIKNKERLIIENNKLRIYRNKKGYFEECNKTDICKMIYKMLDEDEKMLVSLAEIKSVYEILLLDPELIVKSANINNREMINCLNKAFDLTEGDCTLLNHDPKYYFTNYINASYEDEPKCEVFEKFLDYITDGDKEVKHLLEEWAGYLISNMANAKKAAIIYGPPDTGKSLFIRLLSEIIGLQNISNIELQKLNDKTYAAQLFNKKVNFCNDLPSQPIKDFGVFKMLTSELDITVSRQLYHDPKSQPCTTKLVFASNHLPVLHPNYNEDLSAFFNRIVILPFLKIVPEDEKDKNLLNKLLKEKSAILSWAIKGACRYIKNNYSFSYCKKSQNILAKYRMQYNLHKEFINQRLTFNANIYCYTRDLKICFSEFCKDANIEYSESHEKSLIDALKQDPRITYKRINRGGENRWGFMGVEILGD